MDLGLLGASVGLASACGSASAMRTGENQTGSKYSPNQVDPAAKVVTGDFKQISKQKLTQEALETMMALSFVDGMTGLAREKDSVATFLASPFTNVLKLQPSLQAMKQDVTHSAKSLAGKTDHATAFPHANLVFNIAANTLFASGALGPEAQKHALKEMASTTFAVAFLSEKGLLGKGINLNQAALNRIIKDKEGGDRAVTDPEGLIADALFQLCVVAVTNQPWLYAFGNSRLGVQLAPHIQRAVREGLFKDIDTSSFEAFERSIENCPNPNLKKRLEDYKKDLKKVYTKEAKQHINLQAKNSADTDERQRLKRDLDKMAERYADEMFYVIFHPDEDLTGRLPNNLADRVKADPRNAQQRVKEDVADEMLYDGSMGIMETGINSAQTWWGDLGPLLGSIMKHGLVNGPIIASANLPYSYMDGTLHAVLTAGRFGIPWNKVLSKDNEVYQWTFFKNHVRHIRDIGLIAKVAGHNSPLNEYSDPALKYSIKESLKVGNQRIGAAMGEAVKIAARNGKLSRKEVQTEFDKLVASMQNDRSRDPDRYDRETEDLFRREESDLSPQTQTMLKAIEDQVLAEERDASEAATSIGDKATATLDSMVKNAGVMSADFKRWQDENHKNPQTLKVQDFLDFLGTSKTRPWYTGLTYPYWCLNLNVDADQTNDIATDFASLLFFVALQGTSLTGLIPTINRTVYNADWFKRLPLTARELISVQIHRLIASLADNWTDNQVGNDNHALMYTRESYDRNIAKLSEKYYGGRNRLWDEVFYNPHPNYFIPTEFKQSIDHGLALKDVISADPKISKREKAKQTAVIDKYIKDLDQFYWEGAGLVHASSVGGGGETVAGNAPNFPFAQAMGLSFNRSLRNPFRYPEIYGLRTVEMFVAGKFFAPPIAKNVEKLPYYGQSALKSVPFLYDLSQPIPSAIKDYLSPFSPGQYASDIGDVTKLQNYQKDKEAFLKLKQK